MVGATRVLDMYAHLSQRRPVLTNAAVGACVMFAGDYVAQTRLEDHNASLDYKRLFVTTSWNGVLAAPFFLKWFRLLDRLLPGTGMKTVLTKVTVNQFTAAGLMNVGFLAYSTLVEGYLHRKRLEDTLPVAFERVKQDWVKLFISSGLFWMPLNALNFAFVSPQYRVLPTVFGGAAWGCFLSYVGHRNIDLDNSKTGLDRQ